MKKLLSGLTALTIMTATSMTVCAQSIPLGDVTVSNDTVVQPSGGTPFDVNPSPETAGATVEFNVDPTYTVTIPASFELTGEDGGQYSGSGTIQTSKVFLNEGEKIVVTLTSVSKFNMSHEGAGEYKLPYTAEGSFGKLTNKETGGKVAEFPTSTEPASAEISFSTDETPRFAGKYADPVVFGISIEKEPS